MERKTKLNVPGLLITIVVTILVVIIAVNVSLMHSIAANQMESIGAMRLQTIVTGFQKSLTRAETMLDRFGNNVEDLLQSNPTQEEINRFLSEEKALEYEWSDGACLNVFFTIDGEEMIADTTTPDNFVIQDRLWYRGLLSSRDRTHYISPVYQNNMVDDNLCYTAVKFLSDSQTIAGIHYGITEIQDFVESLISDDYGDVLIVDSNETIAGYTDASLIGQTLSSVLPHYQAVYLKAAAVDVDAMTLQSAAGPSGTTLFCIKTADNWYMLCSVNHNAFNSHYGRLILNFILGLLLFAIIVAYAFSRLQKNRNSSSDDDKSTSDSLSATFRAFLARTGMARFLPAGKNADDASGAAVYVSQSSHRSKRKKQAAQPDQEDEEEMTDAKQRQYRVGITLILGATMLIAIVVSALMTIRESELRMDAELQAYKKEITNWVLEQKSILDMFGNVISAQPERLEDYDGMVKFLDDITMNYPKISATYIANPEFSHGHAIVMNNGWVPDPDYNVEARAWYTGALSAASLAEYVGDRAFDSYNVSDPYYDVRTGQYCITFSKSVLTNNGQFCGVFAIDYYMDVLGSILNNNFSSNGYAFLADKNGLIIDHPNSEYNFSASVHSLVYHQLYRRSGLVSIKDYDGRSKVCASVNEPTSGFRLFVVRDWLGIYNNIFTYAFLYVVLFGVCIFVVHLIIYKLIQWQARTNDNLKATAESAIRAEKAKMQFLSNISHELRTPINAVLGMNEMILRECKEETLRSYALNIQSSGRTLLFLINDILDMSKIESGKMKIVPVQYEPGELIVDLWNIIYLRAQGKGLSLSFSMDETVPRVLFGDDVRIKQIVTNILTNAVKYTHKGSVELHMSYSVTGFKMIALTISVKDTGIGIKKEDMSRLFESFQRLDEEKNRNIEGAGLGMSITMSLLKQMGGDMRVESEYQKGSTFTVTIPQRVIDGDPTGDFETVRNRQLQELERSGEHKHYEAPEARVLVVDDNDMNLAVFKALLSRTKIHVVTASSGKKCLELIQEQPFHIVFMDHMMPEMDGIETLREIKKLPDTCVNAQTPVIALTANALAGAREEYLKWGFTDFLTKPIDGELLEAMIFRYLPKDLVHAGAAEQQAEPAAEETSSDDGEYVKYGISVKEGLHYSTGNMEIYLDLIAMFVRDVERMKKLEQFLAESNMQDYSILAHALKSNARTLGAHKLAEIAFMHEKESRADNIDAVKARWDALISAWEEAKEGFATLYQEHREEDLLAEQAAQEQDAEEDSSGELVEVTQEQLSAVADLIDNFDSDKAASQLRAWLKCPLEKGLHDRIKSALVALEDEFDEVRAIKLLRNG